MALNRLTTELAVICRERRTAETWLIAPSYRIGQQWLDAVASAGTPSLNVRVKTLAGLALDLAGPAITAGGLEYLPRRGAELIVDDLWHRVRGEAKGDGYLAAVDPSPSLAAALARTLGDLRMAGVPPEALTGRGGGRSAASGAVKRREIGTLYAGYMEELQGRSLIDGAEAFSLAVQRLRDDPEALPAELTVLVPEDLPVRGRAAALVALLPGRRKLPVDGPVLADEAGITDARLLSHLRTPAAAPSPRRDGTAAIFAAAGEVNEVREVLRRCTGGGGRLDTAEVVHADPAFYPGLIWEEMTRLFPPSDDQSFGTFGYPVTFEEGIPARMARPGRALAAWAAWISPADGKHPFPQPALTAMIRQRLVRIEGAGPADHQRLAGVFRSVPIGWGRERTVEEVDMALRAAESAPRPTEDGEEDAGRRQWRERRAADLALLRDLVAALMATVPPGGATGAALLSSASGFLATLAISASRMDAYAAEALERELAGLARWAGEGRAGSMGPGDWLALVRRLPEETRIGGASPRPGCLHVSRLPQGGNSGRERTFVVGLDDRRHPGTGAQDPILLDAERADLSRDLPTGASQLAERVEGLALLLARLRGTVTLSFPAADLADDRELFPSPALLAAHRIVSGERAADFRHLAGALEPVISFAPESEGRCLDETDWWLWLATGVDRPAELPALVDARFPHLARGRLALGARGSSDFTAWDGRVVEPGPELDPRRPEGPVISPTRIETLGKCPLRYFFQEVLGLAAPQDRDPDPDVWIEPLEFGGMVHGILEAFVAGHLREGSIPDPERDLSALMTRADAELARWQRLVPPPPGALAATRGRLEALLATFLTDEIKRWRLGRPVALEAVIGWSDATEGNPFSSAEPAEIRLPSGGAIRVRGKVDRIDRLAAGGLHLVDYKSGSDYGFARNDPFRGGRIVQNVLYVEMVRSLAKVLPEPETIRSFEYYFPGPKGKGRSVEWSEGELTGPGLPVVERLCRVAAGGAFLASNDKGDCAFCDFAVICDAVPGRHENAARKLGDAGNRPLDPMRELRGMAAAVAPAEGEEGGDG